MADGSEHDDGGWVPGQLPRGSSVGLAVALAVVAAVGTGFALQQLLDRRLSKPEVARLRFYRYLRERGRLES